MVVRESLLSVPSCRWLEAGGGLRDADAAPSASGWDEQLTFRLPPALEDSSGILWTPSRCGTAPVLSPVPGARDASMQLCRPHAIRMLPILRLSRHTTSCHALHSSVVAAASSPASDGTPPTAPPTLHAAAVTRMGFAPGLKSSNQDACAVVHPFLHDHQALFVVGDGHGVDGQHVSSFAAQRVPGVLLTRLLQGVPPAEALQQTFEQVDALISRAPGVDVENSGSTLLVGLLDGEQLHAAWAGDSRAIVGRRGRSEGAQWEAYALTQDHKPELPRERARITALGGRVEQAKDGWGRGVGPFRVWLPNLENPGLAMSRAIGDLGVRNVGVVPTPDVIEYRLAPDDRFLLLASDGVWDYLADQEVVSLVGRVLEQGGALTLPSPDDPGHPHEQRSHGRQKATMTKGSRSVGLKELGREGRGATLGDDTLRPSAVLDACTSLVEAARDGWVKSHGGRYVDDITAVLVLLRPGLSGGPSSRAGP